MKIPQDIIAACLLPLLYLNLAGMAVGAIWIVALSQWPVLWVGIFAVIFSPYLIPILMIPAGILSHFMGLYQKAGQAAKERRMYVSSLAYIIMFLALFCVIIFQFVTRNVAPAALAPGLLWAATSAMTALLIWASRDRGNVLIVTMVVAAQLAMLVLVLLRFFSGPLPFWMTVALCGGVIALVTTARIRHEKKALRQRSR
ncbi:MAG: hypothetical protein HY052_02370 [Proteobacteria bacterium]|nr:hypothetical protein [Pseudomonadota bacterium]